MSEALATMAARAAANPRFLAHRLAAFQRHQGLTDALLALVLAMPAEHLDRLRLCGVPTPERYAAEVARIAAAVGADPARLLDVLQTAEGL